MRWAALVFLVAWQVQEPPPYPAGWYCTPRGTLKGSQQTQEHPCHCKRMADPATSCETMTAEDPKCQQWCHKESCRCPVSCEEHK